jgi:hypothetical protein
MSDSSEIMELFSTLVGIDIKKAKDSGDSEQVADLEILREFVTNEDFKESMKEEVRKNVLRIRTESD